jgi:FAD:protein FMN transferase
MSRLPGRAARSWTAAAADHFRAEALQRARPHLGTMVSIRIRGLEPGQAHAASEAGFAAVADVHRLMSFHEEQSDVSRLNREALAAAVAVDAHTLTVLRRALRFAALSSGAFDVTVARELVELGLLPRPRGGCAAELPDAGASWRDIELLDDGRVRFHRPLWIDLGGIAKGYAVDQALARMAPLAPELQLCVNAGGDLRVCGPAAEIVYLNAPVAQDAVPIVVLENGSLASSSGLRRGPWCGQRQIGCHIHGVRRTPMGLNGFVSVLAPECLVADAFTKIVMALGVRSDHLLRGLGATAYLHDAAHGWRTLGIGA